MRCVWCLSHFSSQHCGVSLRWMVFINNRVKTYGTYKGCLFSLQQLLTTPDARWHFSSQCGIMDKTKVVGKRRECTWHNSIFVAGYYVKVVISFQRFLHDERYLLAGGADEHGHLSGSRSRKGNQRGSPVMKTRVLFQIPNWAPAFVFLWRRHILNQSM